MCQESRVSAVMCAGSGKKKQTKKKRFPQYVTRAKKPGEEKETLSS